MAGNGVNKSQAAEFTAFGGQTDHAGSDGGAIVFRKLPSIRARFNIQLLDGEIPTGVSDNPNPSRLAHAFWRLQIVRNES